MHARSLGFATPRNHLKTVIIRTPIRRVSDVSFERQKGVGWSGRRPDASRDHQGDSVSPFGSPHEISSFSHRIRYYAQILSDMRSYFHRFLLSGHRLGLPHTSAFLMRCVVFCGDASRYILSFRGAFYLKLLSYFLMWSWLRHKICSQTSYYQDWVVTYCDQTGATRNMKKTHSCEKDFKVSRIYSCVLEFLRDLYRQAQSNGTG